MSFVTIRYISDLFYLKFYFQMEKPIPPTHPSKPSDQLPSYAERSDEVLAVELKHYLKQRRKANKIDEAPTTENLAGLCISGGGVRSATLGLGLFQAFINAGILKHFDYMSTVSGGGYIGSCLSSLLSAEPLYRDKGLNNKAPSIPNDNQHFDPKKMGLDKENSPFVDEKYDYPPIETAKLTTKHQLIHLRQHGEYLTPHKGFGSWDVNRAFGALTAGILVHVTMFLLIIGIAVLLHHVLFASMSNGKFILTLQDPVPAVNQILATEYKADSLAYKTWLLNQKGIAMVRDTPMLHKFVSLNEKYPDTTWSKLSNRQQLGAWSEHHLKPQFSLVWLALCRHWNLALGFLAIGFLLGWAFIRWAYKLPYRVAAKEQNEQNFPDGLNAAIYNRPSTEDMLNTEGRSFIRWFNRFNYLFGPIVAYGLGIVLAQTEPLTDSDYFAILALPLCFSLGMFVSLHLFLSLYYISNGSELVSGWLYRSFYMGMQGAALMGLLVATLFPVLIILLFGKHGIAVKLSLSFIPVIVAYYFTMQSLSGRAGASGMLANIVRRLQMPLLNLSIFLFVGLALAWVSAGLYEWEQELQIWTGWSRIEVTLSLLGSFLLFLILLGVATDPNLVSLHYFYRDRLTEAYLRTNGKVEIPNKDQSPSSPSPKNLLKINLRNHADLKLQNLGEGNFKAPYHIIVAALNLQGSNDPSAKTLKSEHFIFSKFFIGSRNTGYASTAEYYFGSTKLSMAMTISAAAVASGMGSNSFAASNFYMTLFNLRTGYWLYNPKFFIQEKKEKARRLSHPIKPTMLNNLIEKLNKKISGRPIELSKGGNRFPFWQLYLGRELTGRLGADTRKVYVSDGGHTGDNLGLLPLVQRSCSTIVIADFEEDNAFSFASFSQAVRLAKAIYNADIEIDLTPLFPKAGEDGIRYSPASVATGRIIYNKEDKAGKLVKKIGSIVYMKSSMSLLKEAAEVTGESIPPPPITERAPVFVLNYFKNNPAFPHQPTTDQYFDEIQFEAYRMLGEHIGKQAAPLVEVGDFGHQSSPLTKAERAKIEKDKL